MSVGGKAAAVRLFDAHCHLQDRRIFGAAPQLIRTAIESGVRCFAVNGVSEKDWHIVKQMGEEYPSVIPCFGLHPWFVAERSGEWFESLREFFAATPSAAVGEGLSYPLFCRCPAGPALGCRAASGGLASPQGSLRAGWRCRAGLGKAFRIGLDKGSHGRKIAFSDQVEVFQKQLELAKELERPVSVHCVKAFGELLEIMQCIGPFPAGVILHSFMGSAEMVSEFTKLGSYFSFSGFLTSMKLEKAKKLLKSVPSDRILFETDAPDALPKKNIDSSLLVPVDNFVSHGHQSHGGLATGASSQLKEELNHPVNIWTVLNYVVTLLEVSEEELAEASFRNATHLFSYPGSKVLREI